MAYWISRANLPTREEQVKMIKDLTIKEKINPARRTQFYQKSVKAFATSDEELRIPYIYASIFLKKSPLDLIPVIHRDYEFSGKMREGQDIPSREALDHLKRFGTTTLHIRPGFGKTMLSCFLASSFRERVLVIHTFKALNEQWAKTFRKNTTGKVAIVGVNSDVEIINADILICMDQRVKKIPKIVLDSLQFLIIDECHTWCTQNRLSVLMSIHPRHIIAASATFDKENGLHKAIEKIVGNHRVRIKYEGKIRVVHYETNVCPSIQYTSMGVNNSALRKSLINNPARNLMIVDIIEQYRENKILVLTWESSHVEILEKLIGEAGITVSSYFGSKTTYVDSEVLVGTIQKMGTGFDPELNCLSFSGVKIDTIILALSVKDVSLFEQIFGRAFRTEEIPQLIYMVDDCNTSQKHWKSCMKWMKEHNTEFDEDETAREVKEEDYLKAEEANNIVHNLDEQDLGEQDLDEETLD
jgi:superfamily II DNA or RNA helicase